MRIATVAMKQEKMTACNLMLILENTRMTDLFNIVSAFSVVPGLMIQRVNAHQRFCLRWRRFLFKLTINGFQVL